MALKRAIRHEGDMDPLKGLTALQSIWAMKTELTNLAATQLFKASACIPHRVELNTCLKGLPIKPGGPHC